jgi:hypothetical protein
MTADFTWPAHRGVLEPVTESRWHAGWRRLGDQVDVAAMLATTCPGRKLGYRFWHGLSRSGPVLVEQSAETLLTSDFVDPGRERDRVRFVVGSVQTHSVALVAALGVVMGDVGVEYVV